MEYSTPDPNARSRDVLVGDGVSGSLGFDYEIDLEVEESEVVVREVFVVHDRSIDTTHEKLRRTGTIPRDEGDGAGAHLTAEMPRA